MKIAAECIKGCKVGTCTPGVAGASLQGCGACCACLRGCIVLATVCQCEKCQADLGATERGGGDPWDS